MTKISDSTDITIPLRNLLAIVFGVSVAVATYFNVDARIGKLEAENVMIKKDVLGNYQWRVDWEKSGLLPADIIQNNKLEFLERRVTKLETHDEQNFYRIKE